MFLTKNPFSDHGPSKQVLSEAFKYHIPEDIPANERTAFHGAAAAAAKAGKKNFNFGGKTHPVTMKKDTAKAIPTEAKVQEISKKTAANYIGKASRDVYHKGQQQGTADAISRLGGPTKDYKKSPERKAAKRVAGIDRATKITSMGPLSYPIGKSFKKNEAMSDAEKAAHQKAIDAFKAKGGKIKKLKPGYAQGYHGKPDPAAGMKGMMDKGDTRAIGTRKKVGSMK